MKDLPFQPQKFGIFSVDKWFSTWGDFAPRGHLTMSGDILVVTAGGGEDLLASGG